MARLARGRQGPFAFRTIAFVDNNLTSKARTPILAVRYVTRSIHLCHANPPSSIFCGMSRTNFELSRYARATLATSPPIPKQSHGFVSALITLQGKQQGQRGYEHTCDLLKIFYVSPRHSARSLARHVLDKASATTSDAASPQA